MLVTSTLHMRDQNAPVDEGRYVVPLHDTPKWVPSDQVCPYCREGMVECLASEFSIVRKAKEDSSQGVVDQLPPHSRVFSCVPCQQRFSIVPQEPT